MNYSILSYILFPNASYSREELTLLLRGKTILLTGASFGIGEELAYQLAATGVRLLLVARSTEKLAIVAAKVQEKGGQVLVFTTDFTDEKQVQLLCNELIALPNGIDIFISNAGKSIRRSIFDSLERPQDFTRTMDINYTAPVKLLLTLIPILKERKGHIINMSAVNVLLLPIPKWSAYQASKTAFDQWLRCIAPELRATGLAVTTIYLPLVRTRMIKPTSMYKKMPAMTTVQVANITIKALLKRSSRIAPWWLYLGEIGSAIISPFSQVLLRIF